MRFVHFEETHLVLELVVLALHEPHGFFVPDQVPLNAIELYGWSNRPNSFKSGSVNYLQRKVSTLSDISLPNQLS